MTPEPSFPARVACARFTGYCAEREVRIDRVEGDGALATVVLLHGGGFVSGSPDRMAAAARALAERLAAVVITPAYTLAPAGAFPAAAEDAYRALQWAVVSAPTGHWDARRLVVIGVEAGGNLAAAAAMMARDRGGPALAAQVLVRPMLDPSLSSRSMRACADGAASRCDAAYRAYLPSGPDRMHPYAAPAVSVRLAGLPPALIVTAADDVLRDEAEAYADRLLRAGVAAKVLRVPRLDDDSVGDAAALDAIAAFVGPRITRI